jgi:hypothetical protein
MPRSAFIMVLALASAGYFLLGQGPITAAAIAGNDAHWKALRAELDGSDAAGTALVMTHKWDGPFRMAGYLLPEYHSYSAGESKRDGSYGWRYSAYGGRSDYALPNPSARPYVALPEGTRRVVALDEEIARRIKSREQLRHVPLAGGASLYVLDSAGSNFRGLAIDDGTLTPVYSDNESRAEK